MSEDPKTVSPTNAVAITPSKRIQLYNSTTCQENFALVNVMHDILSLATRVGGEEQSCGWG